ncbi:MAG: hypothetical protein R2932_06780 [Caldilineaceae bacterium]
MDIQQRGLHFLLPYMRPYSRQLLIGAFYALAGASAQAYSPVLLGYAVDSLTQGVQPRFWSCMDSGWWPWP